jgi:hypothetical protein
VFAWCSIFLTCHGVVIDCRQEIGTCPEGWVGRLIEPYALVSVAQDICGCNRNQPADFPTAAVKEARNLGGGRSEGGGQCVFTSGRLCVMLIGRCCHFLELAMSKNNFDETRRASWQLCRRIRVSWLSRMSGLVDRCPTALRQEPDHPRKLVFSHRNEPR